MLATWWQTIIALVADAGELPSINLLVSFTVTGGDENDIVAEAAPEPSGLSLYQITIVQANTGDVTINGKPWQLGNGTEAPAGYFKPGTYLLIDAGAAYRTIAYGDAEAVQAAVEAVWDDVQAAAAQVATDRDFVENHLIAYVDDDEQSVTVVVATTMVAGEGTAPYPHVTLELVTP